MKSTHHRRRRGAAIVELALVLPVFFAVIFGIIEFGRAMMVSQMVTNSAREGVRLAIVDGTSNSEVETTIREFLEGAAGVAPENVTIAIEVSPAPGNTDPLNQLLNAAPRDLVTVRVEVPFDRVSYIQGHFLKGKTLRGVASMRHE